MDGELTCMYGCLNTEWKPIKRNEDITPIKGLIDMLENEELKKENAELKQENKKLQRKLLKIVDRLLKLLEEKE